MNKFKEFMNRLNGILTSSWGPVITGVTVGILAPILVKLGNPGNMGICVVCFERDTVGALGFHRAGIVQYIRPELIGILLGALIIALMRGEFKPRAGSSPVVRFLLGVFAAIGALIFLGCPWRAYLRLAGGDWNALYGIGGLIVGIVIGIIFLSRGFSLGRSYQAPKEAKLGGFAMPAIMISLLVLLIFKPTFGEPGTSPIFFSATGPGSQHAPWIVALIFCLLVGWFAQRSRFCTVGAIRDVILVRDFQLFFGVLALLVTAFVMNLILGQFHAGFEGQPVAHTNSLWNFLGMVLAGLAFTLAGGCPGRQLVMAGEGDGDAAIFVLGIGFGAAICHNFLLASSGAGIGKHAVGAFVIGMVFCLVVGFFMRKKID